MKVGQKMKDGTVYAGESPTTHLPMYVAPVQKVMELEDAEQFAKDLRVGDTKGFRLPNKAELQTLSDNSKKGALKELFNHSGKFPKGYYWSSTHYYDNLQYGQRLSDGQQDFLAIRQGSPAAVCCIRTSKLKL